MVLVHVLVVQSQPSIVQNLLSLHCLAMVCAGSLTIVQSQHSGFSFTKLHVPEGPQVSVVQKFLSLQSVSARQETHRLLLVLQNWPKVHSNLSWQQFSKGGEPNAQSLVPSALGIQAVGLQKKPSVQSGSLTHCLVQRTRTPARDDSLPSALPLASTTASVIW